MRRGGNRAVGLVRNRRSNEKAGMIKQAMYGDCILPRRQTPVGGKYSR